MKSKLKFFQFSSVQFSSSLFVDAIRVAIC